MFDRFLFFYQYITMILLLISFVLLFIFLIASLLICRRLLKNLDELVSENIKLNKENLLLNIEKTKLTEKASILEAWINMIEKEIDKKLKKEKSTLKTVDLKPQIMELHKKWLSHKEIWAMFWFKPDTVRKAISKWNKQELNNTKWYKSCVKS